MKRHPLASTASPLVILARAPVAGRTKTRLTPAYTPGEAARFANAFISDAISLAAGLRHPVRVCVTGASPRELRSRVAAPAGTLWTAQGTGDLGRRMQRMFQACFRGGARRVVLIGTDSPGLPLRFLRAAYRALDRADVVLGPATDGGYYLVGLSRPAPGLFRDIPWSSASVLRETAARARHLQLRLQLLPVWFDIDRAEDLHTLAGLEAAGGLSPRPRHTLELLRELGLRPPK